MSEFSEHNSAMSSKDGVSQSQLYMWRTLFAIAHADNKVSDEETRFMAEILEGVAFSAEQKDLLSADIRSPQDVEAMFEGITDAADRAKFFEYARDLVHVDGEYGSEEQDILLRLTQKNIEQTNLDSMIGSVNLSFEEDVATPSAKKEDSDDPFQKAFQSLFGKKEER